MQKTRICKAPPLQKYVLVTVLVITVYTYLQLVSTSRMRSVMLSYIPPKSRPKTAGMQVSMC